MGLEHLALIKTDDLPIRHEGDVHNGKVRSVYWLDVEESGRLIDQNNYNIHPNATLGVMVISDRISAFEEIWHAQDGLGGVPGKGAALNAVAQHWFNLFAQQGIARHHILDTPHPLVWVVERSQPVMVEAIVRQYITGSMWRDYKKGQREFGGVTMPDDLKENQLLPDLLFTPSTKGIMKGVAGIPELDDVNVTEGQIAANFQKFGLKKPEDYATLKEMQRKGFRKIDSELAALQELFVDTKFEFGYAMNPRSGLYELIFIDEAGTPDSSRIWDAAQYRAGKIVEKSKEGFRNFLKKQFGIIMTDKSFADLRRPIAERYSVPVDQFMEISQTYTGIAERITGQKLPTIANARQEICDVLAGQRYRLIK